MASQPHHDPGSAPKRAAGCSHIPRHSTDDDSGIGSSSDSDRFKFASSDVLQHQNLFETTLRIHNLEHQLEQSHAESTAKDLKLLRFYKDFLRLYALWEAAEAQNDVRADDVGRLTAERDAMARRCAVLEDIVQEMERSKSRDPIIPPEATPEAALEMASIGDSREEIWPVVDSFMPIRRTPVEDRFQDTMDGLRLVPYDAENTLSIIDRWRIVLEKWVGFGEIDWYPFPPINRLPQPSQAKLIWRYGNTQLSILLNEDETSRCRGKIREAADGQLPGPVSRAGESPRLRISGLPSSIKSWFADNFFRLSHRQSSEELDGHGEPELRHRSGEDMRNDTFLCVDKTWKELQETAVSSIPMVDMTDDHEFFLRATKVLQDGRGGWLQRLATWKSYNTMEFSKFFFLFNDMNVVFTSPSKLSDCAQYEYDRPAGLDADIHMRIIGRTILAGLRDPLLGRETRTVLRGIPKRPAPPTLERKPNEFGWAFHARQGLCLRRIMYWVNGMVALGIAFVPLWLGAIDKVDLQSAFAPVTFLGVLVTLWLAIAALGHAL